MKSVLELLVVASLALAWVPAAVADEADEATITVIDEGDTPEDVARVIELPPSASATATNKAGSAGSDAPNGMKGASTESGRDFGQQVSQDARSGNIADEVRADAAKEARGEARGNSGGGSSKHSPPR